MVAGQHSRLATHKLASEAVKLHVQVISPLLNICHDDEPVCHVPTGSTDTLFLAKRVSTLRESEQSERNPAAYSNSTDLQGHMYLTAFYHSKINCGMYLHGCTRCWCHQRYCLRAIVCYGVSSSHTGQDTHLR